jgi:hypothetical protein
LHIHHFQSPPWSFRLQNMYMADWGCEQRCSLLKVSKWFLCSYLPKICACKNIVFSLIPRTLGVLMCTLIAFCQPLQDLTHVTLRYPYWQLLIFYKSWCKPCTAICSLQKAIDLHVVCVELELVHMDTHHFN